MKHLASIRRFTISAVALLIPAAAQAHPGHGGGDGAGHSFMHLGLGLAAMLFTVGLGFAAKKLSARRQAKSAALLAQKSEGDLQRPESLRS